METHSEMESFLNDIDSKTIEELELKLDEASYKYYNTGKTICTDEEFDFIKEFLLTKFPQTTKYTEQIGCDLAGKVDLPAHMGSMTNIKDIDKFLTDITERQDFSLNMTSIKEEELKSHTLNWLNKLNEKFGNLDKNKLLKTGGYDKHSKHQEKKKQVDRNLTTKDSLNYGAQEGTMR